MSSIEYFNSSGADEKEPHGLNSGRSAEYWRRYASLLKQFRAGVAAGLLDLAWAIGDAFWNAILYEFSLGDAAAEALFRATLLGVPLALLALRRGYVSGAVLALISAYIMSGHVEGTLSGAPDTGWFMVAAHGFFSVMFARASWSAFRLRRLQKKPVTRP